MNSTIQTCTFNQLVLSDRNVRRSRDQGFIADLAENILAYGLLQNLVVSPVGDHYEIDAGGNRYFAIKKLIEGGRLPSDYLIPIALRNGSSHEVSLAENVMRQDMNPIEESEAFTHLYRNEGVSLLGIGLKFGKSSLYVKQRMKLADAHPDLKQRMLDGTLSLAGLMAFTVTDDQERQIAIFNQLGRDDPHPTAIKRALVGEAVAETNKLAQFVTVEAYEAAGGEVTRDLFEQICYLQDAALLEKLAVAKLEAAVKEGDGWKWARVSLSVDWQFLNACGRIDTIPTDGTAQLEDELAALQRDLDAYWEEAGEGEEDDARLTRLESEIEAKENEIQASLEINEGDKAKSGCYAYLTYGGEIEIVRGLIHPDDLTKVKNGQEPAEKDSEGQSEAPEKAKFSQALTDDLQCYRLAAVKVELCDNFAAAFDVMLYELVSRHLKHYFHRLLDASINNAFAETSRGDVIDSEDNQKLQGKIAELISELGEVDSPTSLLEAVVKMPQKSKKALFSGLVSQSLMKPTGKLNEGLFGEIEKRLKVSLRDHWTPNENNLFSRVNAATLCKWITAMSGEDLIVGAIQKKKLVEKMSCLMAEGSDRVKAWLPEVLIENQVS